MTCGLKYIKAAYEGKGMLYSCATAYWLEKHMIKVSIQLFHF